jgi:curved DNA-binding protein
MDYKDYYQILGVSKDASQDEIRRAYRKLARQHHPDVNPEDGGSEERFKEINEAYEVLSDPEKRKKYDRFGTQWRQYERAGGQAEDFDWSQWQAQPGAGASYRTVSPEEFEEIFGGAGGFSDFFETLFGGRGPGRRGRRGGFQTDFGSGRFTQRQARPRSGQDVEQKVEITLEEAFHGTTRTLQYEGGRTIQAEIPPGVKTGSRVRLSGQGQPGAAGGDPGNLYLLVNVLPHERFERRGDDLHVNVPVDLYTAILGGTIVVSSIDRQVRLSIPPQTDNGKTFRLDELGMPQLRNSQKRGDLYATVEVQLPQNLGEQEKELFKQLRELRDNGA